MWCCFSAGTPHLPRAAEGPAEKGRRYRDRGRPSRRRAGRAAFGDDPGTSPPGLEPHPASPSGGAAPQAVPGPGSCLRVNPDNMRSEMRRDRRAML